MEQTYTQESATGHERSQFVDELTDVAERLRMPMKHSFTYELRDGGLFSEHNISLEEVIQKGVDQIRVLVAVHPEYQFELERRLLDREELEEIKTLQKAEKLITVLPIPDDVRFGHSTIDGYDRERMKSLIRVTERCADNTVTITHVSLDRSDYQGLQAIYKTIGEDLPLNLGSEEIAARRRRIMSDEFGEDLAVSLRTGYDLALKDKYGGDWFGGRPPQTHQNALKFVERQDDLVNIHWRTICNLRSSFSGQELDVKLKEARYNFVAILERRHKDGTVVASADNFESYGNEDRRAGISHEGDCPTGLSAQFQASLLGFKAGEWKQGSCRVCQKDTKVGECRVCLSCEEAHNKGGNEALEKISKAVKRHHTQTETSTAWSLNSKRSKKMPVELIFKSIIRIGGVELQALNKKNEIIATGKQAEVLKRSQ